MNTVSETVTLHYGEEEGDFHIEHVRRTEPFARTNHWHGTYEIYYQLSGQRAYFIKDRTFLISPGDLVFIGKHQVHKTSDVGLPGHERVVINFSDRFIGGGQEHPLSHPAMLAAFQSSSRVFSLKLPDQIFVQNILQKMAKEIKERATGYETYVKLLLLELLLFSGRYSERAETTAIEHQSPVHKKISEIVRHINANYPEPMTLTGLSEQFYMSPYYLSRAFKEVTGFTFVEYVNTTRIREAQRLLKESNKKIIEIAELTGFENIAHFGRTFKKLARMTPLEYRKGER